MENCAQLDSIAARMSDRFDFVKDLICTLLRLALGLTGGCLVKSYVTNTLWDTAVNDSMDVLQDLSLTNSHVEMISVAILLLEVTRRAKAYKAAINHNCNTIAEGFCLVHPVSSQHDS